MPQITAGFDLKSKVPIQEREYFSSIAEMKAFNENYINEGLVAVVNNNGKLARYEWWSSNSYDEVTGRWRKWNMSPTSKITTTSWKFGDTFPITFGTTTIIETPDDPDSPEEDPVTPTNPSIVDPSDIYTIYEQSEFNALTDYPTGKLLLVLKPYSRPSSELWRFGKTFPINF